MGLARPQPTVGRLLARRDLADRVGSVSDAEVGASRELTLDTQGCEPQPCARLEQNPETIKMLKDKLLRVPFEIEMHQEAGQQEAAA